MTLSALTEEAPEAGEGEEGQAEQKTDEAQVKILLVNQKKSIYCQVLN